MFSTDARTLKAALSKVLPVVHGKSTIPILGHVRLRVAQDLLTISGTDLDMQVDAEALVEGVPAQQATVNPRPLLGILRLLSGSTAISLTKEDDGLHLHWSGGHAKFASFNPADFPDLTPAGVAVSATLDGAVPKALARVLPFVSTEKTQYYLNGVALRSLDGHACLVATDGRRLCAMPGGASLQALQENIGALVPIIPRAAAVLWLQMFPVGEVTATTYRAVEGVSRIAHFEIAGNGLRLRTKVIDAAFPAVERVIPKLADATASLALPRADMISACRIVSTLATRQTKEGTLRAADGRASLLAKTFDADAIAVDLGESSAATEFGLNLSLFAPVVNAARGATVTLHSTGPFDPILVQGSDAADGEVIVIMPMRVSNAPAISPTPLKAAA